MADESTRVSDPLFEEEEDATRRISEDDVADLMDPLLAPTRRLSPNEALAAADDPMPTAEAVAQSIDQVVAQVTADAVDAIDAPTTRLESEVLVGAPPPPNATGAGPPAVETVGLHDVPKTLSDGDAPPITLDSAEVDEIEAPDLSAIRSAKNKALGGAVPELRPPPVLRDQSALQYARTEQVPPGGEYASTDDGDSSKARSASNAQAHLSRAAQALAKFEEDTGRIDRYPDGPSSEELPTQGLMRDELGALGDLDALGQLRDLGDPDEATRRLDSRLAAALVEEDHDDPTRRLSSEDLHALGDEAEAHTAQVSEDDIAEVEAQARAAQARKRKGGFTSPSTHELTPEKVEEVLSQVPDGGEDTQIGALDGGGIGENTAALILRAMEGGVDEEDRTGEVTKTFPKAIPEELREARDGPVQRDPASYPRPRVTPQRVQAASRLNQILWVIVFVLMGLIIVGLTLLIVR